jgi:hypothetical protein
MRAHFRMIILKEVFNKRNRARLLTLADSTKYTLVNYWLNFHRTHLVMHFFQCVEKLVAMGLCLASSIHVLEQNTVPPVLAICIGYCATSITVGQKDIHEIC